MKSFKKPYVFESSLDNGLKVLICEMDFIPMVSVWCMYHVGSKNEIPGKTGISHLCEHLNFRGTKNLTSYQMQDIIESIGGVWNGYSWYDVTAYYSVLPDFALERALFIEAERMSNSLLLEDDFILEKNIVKNELFASENDPKELLMKELNSVTFINHPYRNPVIGWLNDLENIQIDDIKNFYEKYYCPNNATLVITGNIKLNTALKLIEKNFLKIKKGDSLSEVELVENTQMCERKVNLKMPGTTKYLMMNYHAPSLSDKDFTVMLLIDSILSGAKGINFESANIGALAKKSSRLFKSLIETNKASFATSYYLPAEHPFTLTIDVTLMDNTSFDEIESIIDAEIENFKKNIVPATELQKAKNQLEAAICFQSDDINEIAHQLSYFSTLYYWQFAYDIIDEIKKVSQDDIIRVANKYLNESNRSIGIFTPER